MTLQGKNAGGFADAAPRSASRDGAFPPKRGSAAVLAWVATPQRAVWLLTLLALLSFLPGFAGLPPVDRDEARFVQATKQMVETGDLIDIRFQNEPRYKKPIGIYWLQAGTVATFEAFGFPNARQAIWIYRLPSLAGAVGAVLLTFWAGIPLGGNRAAFVGAAALACSILLGVEARLAKTDAVMLAAIVAMQGALARIYLVGLEEKAAGLRDAVVFWLALSAGTLVKGPVPLLVAGLTILALVAVERRGGWLRGLRPTLGIPLALLVIAPWFVAITLQSGGSFFTESLGKDFATKIATGQESHGAPPLTYLALAWLTFWPASTFLGLAAVSAYASRAKPATRFLLAWLVPAWIVFELVPTKLPHYVLPLYPALALLLGSWLVTAPAVSPPRWARLPGAALLVLAGIVLPLAVFETPFFLDGSIAFTFVPFLVAAVAFTAVAVRAWTRGRFRRAFAAALAASLASSAGSFGVALPGLREIWISPRLAEALSRVACADPALASAGFEEPSLVFLTQRNIRFVTGEAAAHFLGEGGCRAAFVEARQRESFDRGLAARGLTPTLVAHVAGTNVTTGRRLDIAVYAATP